MRGHVGNYAAWLSFSRKYLNNSVEGESRGVVSRGGCVRTMETDGNSRAGDRSKICTFRWRNCKAKPTYKYTFQLPLKIPSCLRSVFLSAIPRRSSSATRIARERNRKHRETLLPRNNSNRVKPQPAGELSEQLRLMRRSL